MTTALSFPPVPLIRRDLDALVHVARLAADERFVDFDFAAQLAAGLALHRQANAVKHEPRGLLGDPSGAVNFVAS